MPKIIPGSQLNSASTDPSKQYANRRRYDTLGKVNGLSNEALELARRVDGVIANRPKDDFLDADELAKFDSPEFRNTLFPEEQAFIPVLWKALEWENAVALTSAPIKPLEEMVVKLIPPQALDMGRATPIDELAAPLTRLAQRIQLVHNSDASATTISLADVAGAAANSSAYLPTEGALMKDLKAALEAIARRHVPTMSARIDLPALGTTRLPLATGGQLKVEHQQTTKVLQETSLDATGRHLVRTTNPVVTVPADTTCVLLNLESGEELTLGPGEQMITSNGPHRAELWRSGARIETTEFNLTSLNEKVKLSSGPKLFSEGNPLFRNVTELKWDGPHVVEAKFEYSEVEANDLSQFDTHERFANGRRPDTRAALTSMLEYCHSPGIPPGRYAVEAVFGGPVTLDVYPEGHVQVVIHGESIDLSAGEATSNPTGSRAQVMASIKEGKLIWTDSRTMRQDSVDIIPSMRIG